jgi:hypothetical protein
MSALAVGDCYLDLTRARKKQRMEGLSVLSTAVSEVQGERPFRSRCGRLIEKQALASCQELHLTTSCCCPAKERNQEVPLSLHQVQQLSFYLFFQLHGDLDVTAIRHRTNPHAFQD